MYQKLFELSSKMKISVSHSVSKGEFYLTHNTEFGQHTETFKGDVKYVVNMLTRRAEVLGLIVR